MLAALDVADATAAFQAIVSAQPGGLGDAAEHDVREPARITLREAMAVAAGRDSIASEYASGYAIVFESGLPLLRDALRDGSSTLDAVVSLHVGLLASARRHADRAQGGRRRGARGQPGGPGGARRITNARAIRRRSAP